MLSQRYFLNMSESGEKAVNLGLILDLIKVGYGLENVPPF